MQHFTLKFKRLHICKYPDMVKDVTNIISKRIQHTYMDCVPTETNEWHLLSSIQAPYSVQYTNSPIKYLLCFFPHLHLFIFWGDEENEETVMGNE